jgi:hypothetical protein
MALAQREHAKLVTADAAPAPWPQQRSKFVTAAAAVKRRRQGLDKLGQPLGRQCPPDIVSNKTIFLPQSTRTISLIPPRTEGCLYSIFRRGAESGGRGMTLRWRCGGAARRSKPQRPGALAARHGASPAMGAGTVGSARQSFGPEAVDRSPRRKDGGLKRSVHRGRCGANLPNTARGTPWQRRTCGNSDFDKPRCREASRSAGPSTLFAHTAQTCVRPGPWRPARPRSLRERAAKGLRRPRAAKNRGGGALPARGLTRRNARPWSSATVGCRP